VWGVAQRESGAARAVELAMQEAGITPETPVQLFGYSQGGIQAALVAHHERFNVVSLVTIGSPVGGIQLDPGIRGLSIGHTEDLVFALDDDQVNAHTVEVTTTRFEPGEPLPHIAGPGHQFQPYVQTLRRIDDSEAPPIRVELDRILGMTDGAVASSATAYRAARD
jgi:pimeloyl-ACP methyl ester carboxylesterase